MTRPALPLLLVLVVRSLLLLPRIEGQMFPLEACLEISSSLPDCTEPYIVSCDGGSSTPECSATWSRYDIRCFACKNDHHDLQWTLKEKCHQARAELSDCIETVFQCGDAPPDCGDMEEAFQSGCPPDDLNICITPRIELDFEPVFVEPQEEPPPPGGGNGQEEQDLWSPSTVTFESNKPSSTSSGDSPCGMGPGSLLFPMAALAVSLA